MCMACSHMHGIHVHDVHPLIVGLKSAHRGRRAGREGASSSAGASQLSRPLWQQRGADFAPMLEVRASHGASPARVELVAIPRELMAPPRRAPSPWRLPESPWLFFGARRGGAPRRAGTEHAGARPAAP